MLGLNSIGLPVAPKRAVGRDEVESLARDGVVLLRDILPEAWIEPLRQATDELLVNPGYLERGQTDEAASVNGRMINGFMGWMHNDVFAALATHSPASEIAKQFLPGQRLQFFYDQLFIKRPGVDAGTPWHRDRNYYAINGKDFLSIWVPFDPALARETALTYIKGSHLNEEIRNSAGEVIPGGDGLPSGLFNGLGPHPEGVETLSWDINIGDVVLHDLNTVHMGGVGQQNSALRRAVALRYLGDDITFNASQDSILNRPDILASYRARWSEFSMIDGQKYNARYFPPVK